MGERTTEAGKWREQDIQDLLDILSPLMYDAAGRAAWRELNESVVRSFTSRRESEARQPTSRDADAAWEALEAELRRDDHWTNASVFIARHRPPIEAAIRASGSPEPAPRSEPLRAALERAVENVGADLIVHDFCSVQECWVAQARAALAPSEPTDE